jgi:hypothetical protein
VDEAFKEFWVYSWTSTPDQHVYSRPRPMLTSCSSTASSAAHTEKVVEFFLERETAEAMTGEVREDEPVLAEELCVEAIEFD